MKTTRVVNLKGEVVGTVQIDNGDGTYTALAIATTTEIADNAGEGVAQSGNIPDSSEGGQGLIELATNTEVQDGTDTGRAVTPAGLSARTATDARTGLVELATAAEAATESDSARALTPAALRQGAPTLGAGAGSLAAMFPQHYQTAPDAASATAVHAAVQLAASAQDVSSGITSPDVPRNVTVKGNIAGVAGNVVVSGTNIEGTAITDTIALNANTEVEGAKAFKTVTNINLPAQTHAPTAQQETATAAGSITTSGNGTATVTADGMSNSPKQVNFAVLQGVDQQETATVVGIIATSGDAKVTVTADGMNNSPKDVAAAVLAGTAQVETATVVAAGDITGAGFAKSVITAAGMSGSPITVKEYVAAGDTAAEVAAALRATIGLDSRITDMFTISGAGADIVLTRKAAAADDATLNITVENDTCTGITDDVTSTDTTPGVAPDNASAVATKIRTALGLDADVAAWFTIGGSGADVLLTAKAEAANDATMNVAIDNDTCAGLTAAPTSADTRAGVAPDGANAIALSARTALGLDADVSAFFDISGATDQIILTAKTPAANDATMNIALADGTCVGITPAPASADTTAGVGYDTVSVGMANKFGLPHIVEYATFLLVKLFEGSTDAGSLAVDSDEIEKNLYALAGTPDGAKLIDLVYLV